MWFAPVSALECLHQVFNNVYRHFRRFIHDINPFAEVGRISVSCDFVKDRSC